MKHPFLLENYLETPTLKQAAQQCGIVIDSENPLVIAREISFLIEHIVKNVLETPSYGNRILHEANVQRGRHKTTIQTDEYGNPFVVIPDEILEKLRWSEETILELEMKDGVIHLYEKE